MIYLDDSATTQLDPRILESMMPYLTNLYGNPSSTHSFGQKSKFAVDEARYTIADYLKCTPQEIIFTSTGSESISLALKGTAEYLATIGDNFNPENVYIITSPLEHSSVIKTISHQSFFGYKSKVLDVDQNGKVYIYETENKYSLEKALNDIKTENSEAKILVSIQYVNSEIGTIQDISEISKLAHKYDAIVHTDAMQAAKLLDISVNNLGVDLLTMAAHKIYGPVGAAILYIKSGSKISRQTDGGEQEYKIRAGTQNTAAIVGLGKAVELLKSEREERREKIKNLSQEFISQLKSKIENIKILCEKDRMESIVAVLFPQINATEFLVRLDMAGIMASAGSACNSGSIQPTENLSKIGLNDKEINSVIRFSIGKNNTIDEINESAQIIAKEYSDYIRNLQNRG